MFSNSLYGIGKISCLPATNPLLDNLAAALPVLTKSKNLNPSPANSSLLSSAMAFNVTGTDGSPTLALTASNSA